MTQIERRKILNIKHTKKTTTESRDNSSILYEN